MRRFQCLLAGTLLTAGWLAAQAPTATPRLTAPVAKTFTFTRLYHTQVVQYRQPALMDLGETSEPEGMLKPEAVIAAQERAYYSGNYEEWLKTWSPTARTKWRERLAAEGKTEAQWSAEHKLKLSAMPRLRLITWVMRRPYVLIQYDVIAEGQQAPIARRTAVLRLTAEGYWKTNLDLEQDPVYLALSQGKTEVADERPNR